MKVVQVPSTFPHPQSVAHATLRRKGVNRPAPRPPSVILQNHSVNINFHGVKNVFHSVIFRFHWDILQPPLRLLAHRVHGLQVHDGAILDHHGELAERRIVDPVFHALQGLWCPSAEGSAGVHAETGLAEHRSQLGDGRAHLEVEEVVRQGGSLFAPFGCIDG